MVLKAFFRTVLHQFDHPIPKILSTYTSLASPAACGKDQLLFLRKRANFAPLQSQNYDTKTKFK